MVDFADCVRRTASGGLRWPTGVRRTADSAHKLGELIDVSGQVVEATRPALGLTEEV